MYATKMLLKCSVDTLSPQCKTTRLAWQYWLRLGVGDRIPCRADLQPPDMLPFITCVILLDIETEPLDFRYRLIGTKVTQHMIYADHTGRSMREFAHQGPESKIFQNCKRVFETGIPMGGQTPYEGPNADFMTTEDVILPLSDDGETVNMLFVVADFVDPD